MNHRAEHGDVEQTKKLFNELKLSVPQNLMTMLHNTMLKAFANRGDVVNADLWYRRMQEQTIRTNNKTLGKLIEAAAKTGDVEAATVWLGEQRDQFGPELVGTNAVLDAYAKASLADSAVGLLRSMEKCGIRPNEYTYLTIISAYANAGKPDSAATWLDNALKHFERDGIDLTSDLERNMRNAVLNAFAKAGREACAGEYLNKMKSSMVLPDDVSYDTVIHACARANKPNDAVEWLARMRVAKLTPGFRAYNSVLDACAKVGNFEKAEEWLKEMKRRNVKPTVVSYTSVICSYSPNTPTAAAAAERFLRDMAKRHLHPDRKLCDILIRRLGAARFAILKDLLKFKIGSWTNDSMRENVRDKTSRRRKQRLQPRQQT